MGKIALISLGVFLYSFLNTLNVFNFEAKVFVLAILSLPFFGIFFLDLYVFVKNPYPFKVKILNLLLENLLGSFYEENKVEFSLKNGGLYCNPFLAEETYHTGWNYIAIRGVGEKDERRFGRPFEEKVYSPKSFVRLKKDSTSTAKEIYKDFHGSLAEISGFLEDERNRQGFREVVRNYNIGKTTVFVSADITNWPVIKYKADVKSNKKQKIIITFEEDCNCTEFLKMMLIWEIFHENSKCGVISLKRGGENKKSKYLHTEDLKTIHERIRKGDVFVEISHMDSGFCVAGGDYLYPETNSELTSKINVSLKKYLPLIKSKSQIFNKIYLDYTNRRFGDRAEKLRELCVGKFSCAGQILRNWECKRFLVDVKYIQAALGMNDIRVRTTKSIPPSRQCYEILKNMNLEAPKETAYIVYEDLHDDSKLKAGEKFPPRKGESFQKSGLMIRKNSAVSYSQAEMIEKHKSYLLKWKRKLKQKDSKKVDLFKDELKIAMEKAKRIKLKRNKGDEKVLLSNGPMYSTENPSCVDVYKSSYELRNQVFNKEKKTFLLKKMVIEEGCEVDLKSKRVFLKGKAATENFSPELENYYSRLSEMEDDTPISEENVGVLVKSLLYKHKENSLKMPLSNGRVFKFKEILKEAIGIKNLAPGKHTSKLRKIGKLHLEKDPISVKNSSTVEIIEISSELDNKGQDKKSLLGFFKRGVENILCVKKYIENSRKLKTHLRNKKKEEKRLKPRLSKDERRRIAEENTFQPDPELYFH